MFSEWFLVRPTGNGGFEVAPEANFWGNWHRVRDIRGKMQGKYSLPSSDYYTLTDVLSIFAHADNDMLPKDLSEEKRSSLAQQLKALPDRRSSLRNLNALRVVYDGQRCALEGKDEKSDGATGSLCGVFNWRTLDDIRLDIFEQRAMKAHASGKAATGKTDESWWGFTRNLNLPKNGEQSQEASETQSVFKLLEKLEIKNFRHRLMMGAIA
jgi:hypothetical protein